MAPGSLRAPGDAGAPDTLSSGSAIRPPTLAHARADQPDCLAAFLTLLAPEGDHSNRARPIVAQLPKTRSGMPRRAPSSGSLAGPVDLAPGSPGEALTASMLSTSPAGGGSSTGPAPMSPGGIIADGPGGGVEPSSGSSAPVQQLNALPPLPLGLVRHVLDSALSIDERLIGLLLSPHSARLLEGERLARLLDVGGPLAGQPPGPAPTRPLSILLFEDLLASQLSSSGSGRSASSVSLTATMGLSSPAPRLGSGGGSGSTGSLKQLPALSSSSSSGFLVNSSSGTLRRQAGGAPTSGLTLYALAVDMLAAGPGSMAGATPGGPDPAASPVLEAYRGLLLGEHSSENVDFWLAVIAFDLDPTLEKMSRICSHFILPAASQEVNLSLPCRRATLDMCLLATDIARSEYYFRLVGGANGGSQDWGITSREDAAHYSQALARMVAEAESASSREVSPHLPAVGEAAGPLAAPATESGGFMRVRSRSRSASSSSADGAPGAAALAEAAASRRTFAWRPEGMTDQSPYWRLVLSDVPASMPMPRGLFSDAQSETLRLMVGDSFPRFLNALAGSRHNRRSG
ncbi:hypothetical protein H696_03723 [Fonticula alba]|uniref:RGS domain-containing protein n=1 Tax=Fonticula alba TaxID=691883 RepID=A0A058Z4S4_FONAL|nr:hypothetical protein H696_03723 [Fonticula alba]KCV69289.1 hypothetical protein H696_03723 [Fonticula alba]|eukprot:XP_009495854.1 hypothetical protein H696_03723 [Fonticula alba]